MKHARPLAAAPTPPLPQAHRDRQLLRGVLLAWHERAAAKRQRRQQLLRAEACFVFMTLLRVLQQWRAAATEARLGRLKVARWVGGCCTTRIHQVEGCGLLSAAPDVRQPRELCCVVLCGRVPALRAPTALGMPCMLLLLSQGVPALAAVGAAAGP